jgi:hypothetical protein
MTGSLRNITLLLGAVVGVPVAFGNYVRGLYLSALRHEDLPFGLSPEWSWFAAFTGCLITGLVLVYLTSLKPTWLRVTAGLLYFPVMALGLYIVNFLVAVCVNTDHFASLASCFQRMVSIAF